MSEVKGSIDFGLLRRVLRGELKLGYDLPASRSLGEADFCHVGGMIRAANRLFISVGPTGEFYVLDDAGLRLIYRWPEKATNNWRGTFFGHCYWSAQNSVVFAGFANPQPPYGNALLFIDPTTLKVERLGLGGGAWYELFSCIEHDGALYVTGEYDYAGFYKLTDKKTYVKLSTIPKGLTGHALPRALAYFNGNFVVAEEGGQALFRSPDGVNWTKVMDTPDKLIALTTDGARLLVGGTDRVYYVNTNWSYGVAFRLPRLSCPYNFIRLPSGWALCGSANNYGVLIVNPVQEYYFTFNPQIAYMTPYSGLIDVDQYGGKVVIGGGSGLWSGQPARDGQPAFIDIVSLTHKPKLYPLTFAPWSSTSISAGAETDPIPTLGYEEATIVFKSNVAGDLTVYVDSLGNGDWDVYLLRTATSKEIITIDEHFARVKLGFSASATVTAKVYLK